MTEEIIIDGVDVAGCEYLCTNQMGNNCLNHNRGFSMNCKNTSDCYYKQLQREKLQSKVTIDYYIEKQKQLLDEIDFLRGNRHVHPDSAYYKIAMLRCKNDKLEKSNFNLCILIDKYRRAFEEIKNMLPGECFNKNQCNYCPHNNANLCTCNIAIKISEVLK